MDANVILNWERCQNMARELHMNIYVLGNDMVVEGTDHKDSHKGLFTCQNINEMVAFLYGVTDSRAKQQAARTAGNVKRRK